MHFNGTRGPSYTGLSDLTRADGLPGRLVVRLSVCSLLGPYG